MLKLRPLRALAAWVLLLCAVFTLLPAPAAAADAADATKADAQTVQRTGLMAAKLYREANRILIVGCLEEGTRVTVLGSTKSYYKVDCHDMTAYIPKDQLAKDAEGSYFVQCDPDSKDTSYLPTYSAEEALTLRNGIRMEALKHQGTRYVWGGTTTRGFDCSGFTQYVFKKNGHLLTRSCRSQMQTGLVITKDELQCGDLVFFSNTTSAGFSSHLGIYIGDGKMIHASSKRGIVVVDLDNDYHNKHFLCARRIILSEVNISAPTLSSGVSQNINSSYWRENSQTVPGLGTFFAENACIMAGKIV